MTWLRLCYEGGSIPVGKSGGDFLFIHRHVALRRVQFARAHFRMVFGNKSCAAGAGPIK